MSDPTKEVLEDAKALCEGKAALEAAGRAVMAAKTLDTPDGEADPRYVAEAAIRAYLFALPGWRLVPVDPTDRMVAVADQCEEERTGLNLRWYSCDAWITMIAELPSPPGLEPDGHD